MKTRLSYKGIGFIMCWKEDGSSTGPVTNYNGSGTPKINGSEPIRIWNGGQSWQSAEKVSIPWIDFFLKSFCYVKKYLRWFLQSCGLAHVFAVTETKHSYVAMVPFQNHISKMMATTIKIWVQKKELSCRIIQKKKLVLRQITFYFESDWIAVFKINIRSDSKMFKLSGTDQKTVHN